MSTGAVRCATLVVLLALASGCGDAYKPTAPSRTSTQNPPPTATQPTFNFPPVAGPARVYVAVASPLFHPHRWASRYVLYDDGKFVLEYPDWSYPGSYFQTNGLVTFEWAGSSGATGTLDGNTLTVRYSELMVHSDFEDGVYMRQ